MNIKDITDFIKNNKELLDELKGSASGVVSDVKALLVESNKKQAEAFVAALDGNISVAGSADRLSALDAAIAGLESEMAGTDDTLRQMELKQQRAMLLQMRANVAVSAGFDAVVAFTPEEKGEIERLLKEAQDDIEARKNVKTAIDITVRLIAIAARIAGKVATFGIA